MPVDIHDARDASAQSSAEGLGSRRATRDLIASGDAAIDERSLLIQLHAGKTDSVRSTGFEPGNHPAATGRAVNLRAAVAVCDVVLLAPSAAARASALTPLRAW